MESLAPSTIYAVLQGILVLLELGLASQAQWWSRRHQRCCPLIPVGDQAVAWAIAGLALVAVLLDLLGDRARYSLPALETTTTFLLLVHHCCLVAGLRTPKLGSPIGKVLVGSIACCLGVMLYHHGVAPPLPPGWLFWALMALIVYVPVRLLIARDLLIRLPPLSPAPPGTSQMGERSADDTGGK